jgi:hypothetical protein
MNERLHDMTWYQILLGDQKQKKTRGSQEPV